MGERIRPGEELRHVGATLGQNAVHAVADAALLDLIDARAEIARLTAEIAGLREPVKAGLWCGPWRDDRMLRIRVLWLHDDDDQNCMGEIKRDGWNAWASSHDDATPIASGPETGPAAEALCVAALRAAGVEVRL